jgi:L-threonylcarbamoyladenylate synthase
VLPIFRCDRRGARRRADAAQDQFDDHRLHLTLSPVASAASRGEIERVLGAPLAEAVLAKSARRAVCLTMRRRPLRLDAASAAGEALRSPPGQGHRACFRVLDLHTAIRGGGGQSRPPARTDVAGATAIAVTPIPHEGLGEAINDRPAARRRSDEFC